ncbi:DUF1330 domain-containing protein [Sphingobium sp. AN558]|uniref:DUF1330 domain-containing protein n=1 Tax=Sphingobium sp. AN558 TaxID=3133442 RepID=UPI0030BE4C29
MRYGRARGDIAARLASPAAAIRDAGRNNNLKGNVMAAYMVVLVYLDKSEWVADYVANVPDILRKYGGEYFAVSERVVKFEGDKPTPDQVALFTFPSIERMQAFVISDEYAPYKDARLAQSNATIIGFEPRP